MRKQNISNPAQDRRTHLILQDLQFFVLKLMNQFQKFQNLPIDPLFLYLILVFLSYQASAIFYHCKLGFYFILLCFLVIQSLSMTHTLTLIKILPYLLMRESLLYQELLRYFNLPLASISKSRYQCPQAPLCPIQYRKKKSSFQLIVLYGCLQEFWEYIIYLKYLVIVLQFIFLTKFMDIKQRGNVLQIVFIFENVNKMFLVDSYPLNIITPQIHPNINNNPTQTKKHRQHNKKMSLQQKQQYLRTEIVQKGADAEQFYIFWQNFGIELANATMEDVIAIVAQFHHKNQKQQDKNGEEDQFGDYVDPEQNHDSHFYQDINWDFLAASQGKADDHHHRNKSRKDIQQQPKLKIQNKSNTVPLVEVPKVLAQPKQPQISVQKQKNNDLLISVQSPNINNVTFQDVIKDSESIKRKCLKLQPNILEHHTNVQIYISKKFFYFFRFKEITQENSGIINKLWKGTYLLFTIKTIGRNKSKAIGISWEVQRQHSDFQWLRNTLIKMYPGLVVPPLPSIVKSQDQLNGYQRKLEGFLLDCYNCPELRNSKYFQVFLSYASQKDFQAFKKTCESTSKPKNLTHILNMQGELQLLYSQKIDSYAQGLQNFLTKSSQHLKNVKSIITQIDDSYSQISQKYKQLSQVFITMSEESCQFSDEECYPRLTQTYRQISQLVNQHSYFCMLEKEFLETFMFSHFAYERDRVDNMQNLIAKRKTFTLQFAKPKHQQEKPAESTGTSVFGKIAGLFGQKSQSLQIPSSDTTTLRDQVGYYNSQLMKQSIRCIQGMISSHVNHFSMYGHSRIDNVQSMQKLWSKLLVELSKLNTR